MEDRSVDVGVLLVAAVLLCPSFREFLLDEFASSFPSNVLRRRCFDSVEGHDGSALSFPSVVLR